MAPCGNFNGARRFWAGPVYILLLRLVFCSTGCPRHRLFPRTCDRADPAPIYVCKGQLPFRIAREKQLLSSKCAAREESTMRRENEDRKGRKFIVFCYGRGNEDESVYGLAALLWSFGSCFLQRAAFCRKEGPSNLGRAYPRQLYVVLVVRSAG